MNHRAALLNGRTIVLVVLGVTAIAGGWENLHLAQERHALRTELAIRRGDALPAVAGTGAELSAEIVRLTRDLAKESAALTQAETAVTELQKTVPPVAGEELRSFGYIEQMGLEAGEFLTLFVEFITLQKQGTFPQLPEAEQSRLYNTTLAWANRLPAIGELETTPAEIARFHATSLQSRLKLDGATTGNVRQQLEQEFQQLNQQGLARPQRPESEQEEWYKRRKQALDAASARVEALIPANERQPYAVGQSLYLGTGMRSKATVGTDGHGSVNVALELPGIDMK